MGFCFLLFFFSTAQISQLSHFHRLIFQSLLLSQVPFLNVCSSFVYLGWNEERPCPDFPWVRDSKVTPSPEESFRAEPGRELTWFHTPTDKHTNKDVLIAVITTITTTKSFWSHSPAGLKSGRIQKQSLKLWQATKLHLLRAIKITQTQQGRM